MIARAALCLVVLAGCAGSNKIVSLGEPSAQPLAKDYVDQIKRWSRHGVLRSDFDAMLTVDATFQAPEFRAAYIAKYLDVYHVTEGARAQVVAAIPAEPDAYELHVETQTHTWEINELKTRNSIWRVSLVNDGGQEVAVKDIKPESTRPEVLQIFYPYTQIFSKPWRVIFPRTLPDGSPLVSPETKSLTLRIAGPAGAVDLIWQLK